MTSSACQGQPDNNCGVGWWWGRGWGSGGDRQSTPSRLARRRSNQRSWWHKTGWCPCRPNEKARPPSRHWQNSSWPTGKTFSTWPTQAKENCFQGSTENISSPQMQQLPLLQLFKNHHHHHCSPIFTHNKKILFVPYDQIMVEVYKKFQKRLDWEKAKMPGLYSWDSQNLSVRPKRTFAFW